MPSDDETDEDEAIYSSDSEHEIPVKKPTTTTTKIIVTQAKSTLPLPSDEEDNTGKTLSLSPFYISPLIGV